MKKLKRIGYWLCLSLLVIIAILGLVYSGVYFHTEARINKVYSFQTQALALPTDSESILKGEHIYKIRGCQDCHGKNLEGSVFMDDAMLMKIAAPNLTKGNGGLPSDYTTQDWIRVIRHGVKRDGRSLMMMPSQELYQLSNEDLSSLIAFIANHKPVNSTVKNMRSIGPVGRVLMAMDNVTILPAEKINHSYKPQKQISVTLSLAYGKYLATGCQGCHRYNLQGGAPLAPGFPPVPDITSKGNIGNWQAEDFVRTIRTGTTPEDRHLDNQFMPWQSINHFTDEELNSIYQYLKSLPE